jgi:hypothetical protein
VSDVSGALARLVDEIEETAQLVTLDWQLETGATPLTVEQQQAHDLGMTAGMQATVEILYRRGMLHLTGQAAPTTALSEPTCRECAGELEDQEAVHRSGNPLGPGIGAD